MAKRSLDNAKDTQAVNEALEGGQKGRIKLDKKTYIRLLSKDYVAEFVHYIDKKAIVCLGDYEKDKGRAPKKCPACLKIDGLWEKYNKAKSKAEKAEILDKEIKLFQSVHQTFMAAVKGVVVTEEDEDGDLKSHIQWEKEAKILSVSKAQWIKLTADVFSDFDFMKTPDDLINRSFVFSKEEKKAKKQGDKDYTEVQIKPVKKKSKAPKIENDLPDLEEFFHHIAKKEMIEMLDSSDDLDVIDEDLQEEEKTDVKENSVDKAKEKKEKAAKLKAKKEKDKAKKEAEEKKTEKADDEGDPDFVTDADEDDFNEEDLVVEDEDDEAYDDFED